VFASWGSLGHVAVAESGALIGFLGPVVYRTLHGQPFPEGVQVAENLVDKGIIDAVVPTEDLADVAARALALLSGRPRSNGLFLPTHPASGMASDGDAWSSIILTRRPGVRKLLRYAADDVLLLNGTQSGESDAALLLALAAFSGTSCVLVGQDRRTRSQHRPLGPAALRGVIDTPGADLSAAAEEGALAGEIARCLAEMVELTVPTVSILLGEGTGGGALALLPSCRVIAAGNAWLSPLPPEGASTIMHGTPEFAPQMVRRQRVRAFDLLADGTVHAVVPEQFAAHEDPAGFARRIADECIRQIKVQRRTTE
jgi:acyl-CoA carboxylase subunit beta